MLAILQARTSSSRLPGKVLRPILGVPMLARQIERLKRSAAIDRIVVATSDQPSDDPLQALAADWGVLLHRGPLDDVLARFAGAVARFGPDDAHVLRLTGDCPLADPALIDAAVAAHLRTGADLTHVSQGWTYPKGLDVEVVRTAVLLAAHAEAAEPDEREHVTLFIHRRPQRFAVRSLTRDPPLRYRWTVDTPEDFAFVAAVYADLYPADPAFTSADVLAWQAAHPDLVLVHTP
jgi:spore coat polysaccharide biosynthesis protein SpsF